MRGILFKLWTGMMTLVVTVLILLWLFQIVFLQSFYTGIRVSNVRNQATSILNDVKSTTDLQNRLDEFSYTNSLTAEVLDKNGNSVLTAGNMGSSMQMPMMRNSTRIEVINEAINGKTSETTVTHPRFGNKFMFIGIPYKKDGNLAGALLITMPLAAVEETSAILRKQLFYITIILLVASIVISFLISKGFTKPILEIKRAADKMASGDFSVRLGIKNRDELGRLAGTINNLGQQLSRIEQLRKDLIANVSHELRTPLSLIRGYAETIRDVSGNNEEKREKHLGIIIEETERLSGIVDDILNLSQLQSGYTVLDKTVFSSGEILDKIAERYELASADSGINLKIEADKAYAIEADKARIEQVFYNLINNAFSHTPKEGVITVKSMNMGDHVRFEVVDTGSGIPEEELQYIWDRFYKADKTKTGRSTGTGLGLSIVKGILEAHNSKYGVESRLDAGTTFWFELNKSNI